MLRGRAVDPRRTRLPRPRSDVWGHPAVQGAKQIDEERGVGGDLCPWAQGSVQLRHPSERLRLYAPERSRLGAL